MIFGKQTGMKRQQSTHRVAHHQYPSILIRIPANSLHGKSYPLSAWSSSKFSSGTAMSGEQQGRYTISLFPGNSRQIPKLAGASKKSMDKNDNGVCPFFFSIVWPVRMLPVKGFHRVTPFDILKSQIGFRWSAGLFVPDGDFPIPGFSNNRGS